MSCWQSIRIIPSAFFTLKRYFFLRFFCLFCYIRFTKLLFETKTLEFLIQFFSFPFLFLQIFLLTSCYMVRVTLRKTLRHYVTVALRSYFKRVYILVALKIYKKVLKTKNFFRKKHLDF